MVVQKTLRSFNSGELSPRILGRSDFDKYDSGCKTLENMLVTAFGGVQKRSGTLWQNVDGLPDPNKTLNRIMPFKFSSDETYIISFITDTNGEFIEFYKTDQEYTQFQTVYVEFETPASYDAYNSLSEYGYNDLVSYSGRVYISKEVSNTGNQPDISPSSWQIENDSSIYRLNSPFTASQSMDVKYRQSGDIVYMTHPDVGVYKLSRTSASPFRATLKDVNLLTGPFLDENEDDTHALSLIPPPWATATAYSTTDVIDISTNITQALTGFTYQDKYIRIGNFGQIVLPNHGFKGGERIVISGTGTAWDGTWTISAQWGLVTTNIFSVQNLITGGGTFGAGNVVSEGDATLYRAITNHTSGAGNPIPPGNTTDWELINAITGSNSELVSSEDLFTSGHVGALFKLSHVRNDNLISGSNGVSSFSTDMILVDGDWEFETNGTWTGLVEIQRSEDEGVTWEPVRSRDTTGITAANYSFTGEETENNIFYRVSGTVASGTIEYQFNIKNFFLDGIVKVTAVTDARNAECEVIQRIASKLPTVKWSEGAFSDANGFPNALAIFEERLYFGGTKRSPQSVWGSVINDWENFSRGTNDDDAFAVTLASDQVDDILWMIGKDVLAIGTTDGVWKISSSNRKEVISSNNITAKRQSGSGSSSTQPAMLGDTISYVEKNKRKLMLFQYSFEVESFKSSNLSNVAEHIVNVGIKEIVYQRTPQSIMWCLLEDGSLAGLTYNQEDNVSGWHRHTYATAQNSGIASEIQSIVTLPDGNQEQLWMIMSGPFGNHLSRTVDDFFLIPDSEPRFLDLHVTDTVSGGEAFQADFMIGNVVDIYNITKGEYAGSYSSETDSISVSGADEGDKVVIGLKYTSTLEPMPIEVQLPTGSSQGQYKRHNSATYRTFKTQGFDYGTEDGSLDSYTVSTTPDGSVDVEDRALNSAFDRRGNLMVVSDKPYPVAIDAIFLETQAHTN